MATAPQAANVAPTGRLRCHQLGQRRGLRRTPRRDGPPIHDDPAPLLDLPKKPHCLFLAPSKFKACTPKDRRAFQPKKKLPGKSWSALLQSPCLGWTRGAPNWTALQSILGDPPMCPKLKKSNSPETATPEKHLLPGGKSPKHWKHSEISFAFIQNPLPDTF